MEDILCTKINLLCKRPNVRTQNESMLAWPLVTLNREKPKKEQLLILVSGNFSVTTSALLRLWIRLVHLQPS